MQYQYNQQTETPLPIHLGVKIVGGIIMLLLSVIGFLIIFGINRVTQSIDKFENVLQVQNDRMTHLEDAVFYIKEVIRK